MKKKKQQLATVNRATPKGIAAFMRSIISGDTQEADWGTFEKDDLDSPHCKNCLLDIEAGTTKCPWCGGAILA